MNIIKNLNDGVLEVAVEGRLDTTTAPDLEKEVSESLEGVKELIFNLEKLEYISSAGLRVLLVCHKNMKKQGEMKVVGCNDVVYEIFEITGFSDILTIERTGEEEKETK